MAKTKGEGFGAGRYLLFAGVTVAVFLLCICVGSVTVPLGDTAAAIRDGLFGGNLANGTYRTIILDVRLPRVLCVALVGASLALCGGAMQGLLRNPLADGSTLGVSSGASLGAVLAIAFGSGIPGFGEMGVMFMAILFAFLSLVLILSLAYKLDYSLSTSTIILIGVIFSMFANAMISLIATYASDKVRTIFFWTMGSMAGCSYGDAATVSVALVVCGAALMRYAGELNAFALGEAGAHNVGINISRVKLVVLIAVSALIGICVSIGGTIGFVGLIIPHITRMLTGPNHRKLLPASMFAGAVFLMLADLVARVLLSPLELPIGVVTSIIGSVVFVFIFYHARKVR